MKKNSLLILFSASLLFCLQLASASAQGSKLFYALTYGAVGSGQIRTLAQLYATQADAQAAFPTLPLGQVYFVQLTDPGFGCTSAPTLAISGDGTGATATATVAAANAISHIKVDAGGSNYKVPPDVYIANCAGASAIAETNNGSVKNVRVNASGTCTGTPSVQFTQRGGIGSGAAATAYLGGVTKLTLTSTGANYWDGSAAVTFSGGGCTQNPTGVVWAYDKNSERDWAGIQAASDAAEAVSGTVWLGAGIYRLNRKLQINRSGTIKGISLIGEGRLATQLLWFGHDTAPWFGAFEQPAAIEFNFNKQYDARNFKLVNSNNTKRLVTGIHITGPNAGTQGGNASWTNIEIDGFDRALRIGNAISGVSGSEFSFRLLVLRNSFCGLIAEGGNTEDLNFEECQGVGNSRAFVFVTSNNAHVFGGSATGNGIDFSFGTNGAFSLNGFRSESSGQNIEMGTGNLTVRNCHFQNLSTPDRTGIRLTGGPFQATFDNNLIAGFIGVTFSEPPHSAVVLNNNRFYQDGALLDHPFKTISGGNLNGLYYNLQASHQYSHTNQNAYIGPMTDRVGRFTANSVTAYKDYWMSDRVTDRSATNAQQVFKVSTNDPTTADISLGNCAFWKNTTADTLRWWCNDGGTIR